jgi:inner membrane protein
MYGMDSITQGLLGAVTAQLGFRQRIGRDATWLAAGAAMLPDLDVLVRPILSLSGMETDGLTMVTIHRGLSHSLLMVPLIALPVALIWWQVRRPRNNRRDNNLYGTAPEQEAGPAPRGGKPPPFWLLYACLLAAVLSHPLLDWCTSYGTQLLLPITNARYAIDAVPIIDIIYTPILAVTLIACYVVHKVTPARAARWTLILGWAGMALSSGYIAAGRAMHDLAVRRALGGLDPSSVITADAYPSLGTIFLWRTVVRTQDQWRVAGVHVFSSRPLQPACAPQADNEWVRRAMELQDARVFDWFAMGRTRASYARRDGLHFVEFHDMRYGLRPDSLETLWGLRVTFDQDGSLVQIHRFHAGGGFSLREAVRTAWKGLWNP